MENRWYLVKTKPRCENRVYTRLSDAGFDALFPKVRKKARHRGVFENRPFFPTYLFVRFSIEQLRLIRYTPGVARVVSFGADPEPVQEEIVASVRARMDEEGLVMLAAKDPGWKAGQTVTIGDGPLSGIEGVFVEALPDRQRVVLLLDAVSRYRVVVPMDSIERA